MPRPTCAFPGTQHMEAAQDMVPAFARSCLEEAWVFRTAESSGSPQVSPGDTWQRPETFLVATTRERKESLLASSGWEAGMLRTTLPGTGRPPHDRMISPTMSIRAGVERSWSQEASAKL